MKRFIALISTFVVFVAPAASAQTVSEVVAGLGDGVYVDPGLSRDMSRLSASVSEARNAGFEFYVVLLDESPVGGSTTFADAILYEIGSGSVLVVSARPDGSVDEGFVSSELERAQILEALAAGSDAEDDESFVSAVVTSITGTSPTTGSSGGGGGSGLLIMLVIVGGLVLLVWWAIRRSSTASKERRGSIIEEARAEIKGQLDSMANTILEISDIVSASASGEDNDYLERAGATYTAALESYETATDLAALEQLSDTLDESRWELDAATAIAEGREVPPKPATKERPACFFDPTHRDATEMADIQTATGTRTVRVCREDAERLKRGSQPQPRMIDVQGRRVPAPMAPKSHGGGGMDWLETFSVLAGGAGQAMSYDWGTRHPPAAARRATSARQAAAPTASSGRERAGRTRRRRR